MRMRRHGNRTHSESQDESIEVADVTEHVRDHRSESTVAEAVLKLLEVRASELKYQGVWMDKYRSPPGQVMTDDQIKNAWNIRLKLMSEDVMDDHEATDEGIRRRKRRKLNHGRFNSWLFLRFGRIRDQEHSASWMFRRYYSTPTRHSGVLAREDRPIATVCTLQ